MNLLIVENNRPEATGYVAKTSCAPNLKIARLSKDLCDAYHFAEHHEPDAVLVGLQFACRPEFEVMNLMLQALTIRCILLVPQAISGHATQTLAKRLGASVLDASLNESAFCASLSAILDCPKTNSLPKSNECAKPSSRRRSHSFVTDQRILLGSSTGGVEALLAVLTQFPVDCPPTMVVQHTGASFSAGLAKLLDSRIAPNVTEARDGQSPESGQVLLAPGSERHLVLSGRNGRYCRLKDDDPVSGHRPSVDELFNSAIPFANTTVAAILTGMGRDGAGGLTKLRQAGAMTFGQDERTSVVYGMPKVAFEMGGVEHQLPIDELGTAILQACCDKKGSFV